MVATERIEWLGEASRRKVLLDDGHVIQVQVNSEKYQGTLVFVRHTDHVAGLGFLQGERVQTVKELLGERGLKNK